MTWYHGTRYSISGAFILPGGLVGKPSNYPDHHPGGMPTTDHAWATSFVTGAAGFALGCKTEGDPAVYEVEPFGTWEPDPRVFGAIRVSGLLKVKAVVPADVWVKMVDQEDGAIPF